MPDQGSRIEKRVLRIERWLRRCAAACRCGSWSAALMEIECMEAEARGVREEIWNKAESEALEVPQRSAMSRVFFAARVAVLALMFVMFLGLPWSAEDGPDALGGMSVQMLTSTESEIISALRMSLSSANSGTVIAVVEMPEAEVQPAQSSQPTIAPSAAMAAEPVRPAPRARAQTRQQPPRKEQKEQVSTEQPARRRSAEDVLALIQIGERALRMNGGAVTVIR